MGVKMVLKASYILVATNDLSAFCSKVQIAATIEEKDVTTFASAGWKEMTGGLGSGSVALDFFNDFTVTTGIDGLMWPVFIAGVPVAYEFKASNAARSTSNPSYTGNLLVSKWNPVDGAVGDVDAVSVQWPTSGIINRLTA